MTTFNEHGAAMIEQAKEHRDSPELRTLGDEGSAAARDLSIAITSLEDALTRYNSARYHMTGAWTRRDPDKETS